VASVKREGESGQARPSEPAEDELRRQQSREQNGKQV